MADPPGANSPPLPAFFSSSVPNMGAPMGGVDASSNLQPLQIDASGQLKVAAAVSVGSVAFSTTAVATTTQASGVTGALVYLAASQTVIVAVNNATTAVATTTQASGVTGALVYLAASQTMTVTVAGGALGSNYTSQSSLTTGQGVWLAPSQTMAAVSTVGTVLGTVAVSQVGPVSISAVVPTTTASGLSGVTGLPVWVANPGSGSGATATATSQSAMSTALGVWLAQTQTLSLVSTIVTILGTQVVTVVPGLSVSAVVSGTVSLVTVSSVGTVVTVLGTVLVSAATPISISGIAATTTASGLSGVTGLPVWVANPGSGSGATATATSQSAMSTALGVWLAQTQTLSLVSTIITVLGTQVVTVVPGLSVSAVVSGTVSLVTVSSVGTVVTVLGTQIVSVVPNLPVQISGITPTTTGSGLSGVTGLPVWLIPGGANTTVVSGTVSLVTVSTVGTVVTLLGTINVSGPVQISGITPTTTGSGLSGVTGLPVWLIPGGANTTVVSGTLTVVVSGVTPTTTASGLSGVTAFPVWVANPGSGSGATASATSQSAMSTALGVWLAQTQTLSLISTIVTLLGTVLVSEAGPVSISGIAATTTASGLSGVTGLPVWVANPGSGSGATASATSQSAMSTALGVWLAQTQTLSLVSTIVTVLGTQVVTVVPGLSVSAVVSGTISLVTVSTVATVVTLLGTVNVSQQGAVSITSVAFTTASSGLTATATGLIVVATGTVTAVVTGTVSLVTVSSVGTVVTLLGTVNAAVVNAISISAVVPTTTASGLSGVTGLPVWVANPGSGSGATASATSQSAMSTALGVWLAQTQTLSLVSTIVTILGTQIVSVVPGLSVSAVVSGTVSLVTVSTVATIVTLLGTINAAVVNAISISSVVATTTASGLSGVTGLPVWVANPGSGSGATASATSQSAMSTALGVWLAQTQTLALISTIVTILGTQIVSVVPGLSVLASVSGVTPTTTASGLSGVTGLPVWVANPGSGSGATATATSQSAMSTALGVWLAQTQTLSLVSTIVTVLGTVLVSQVAGAVVSITSLSFTTASSGLTATATGLIVVATMAGMVNTTTASGLSGVTGLPVWVGNTISVSVTAVLLPTITTTTGSGVSGATGYLVWVGGQTATQSSLTVGLPVVLAGTQTMALVSTVATIVTILGTVVVTQVNPGVTIQQSAQTPVNIAATIALAAAASSSGGPIPFTINVGSTAATVTSAWSIPATNFRLNFVNILMTGAGATTPTVGYFQIAYSSSGTTGTATSPTILATKAQLVKIPVGLSAAAASFGIQNAQMDIGGGLTQTLMLWFNYAGTTNTSMTALIAIMGYLF